MTSKKVWGMGIGYGIPYAHTPHLLSFVVPAAFFDYFLILGDIFLKVYSLFWIFYHRIAGFQPKHHSNGKNLSE
jgi:uncharacterized membrane protein